MFETTAIKSLERAPELVAIIVIVIAFLRFMQQMTLSHGKRTDEFIATVKVMHEDANTSRDRSTNIIAENIKTTALNTAALAENTRSFHEFVSTAKHQQK